MPDSKPRQLPLDLGHAPRYSRDDLVVSPANRAAVALLDRWPDWHAPVTVLAGPTGSGKTHLAAVWRERAGARQLHAADLREPALAAADPRPVLIDDIDAGPIDEAGLFHLINAVLQAGTHMLVCSRRFPAAWGVALPDLASRLKAASVVEIGEPDDLLLAGVITKLFADRQVEIEPHVVQFLARRIERSLSAAIGVVDRLDRAALESKSRITRALAAEVIERLERQQD
ncbi:MAG: hypothetical protein J0H34_06435 [Rhizobiales bacterium]|nr:hypothetical protein [Hyphomicrobiales bacterium]